MAHKLDSHYNDFGGVDTRSNEVLKPSTTARSGSQNFEYNFQDEIVKRRGFMTKMSNPVDRIVDLIEYKYRDINTGEAKIETLCIQTNGNLYKLISNKLELSFSSSPAVTYTIVTTSTTGDYKFEAYDLDGVSLGLYAFDETETLDDLKTGINALAITGLTADIVDDDGTSISSSLLAGYLDLVLDKEVNTSDVELNSVYDWQIVVTPGLPPFSNAQLFDTSGDYEGISYTNLNNVCYITDGGWLYKYDGFSVYRAGMPEFLYYPANTANSLSGFTLTPVNASTGAMDNSGVYKYRFQYGFTDPNGFVVWGKTLENMSVTLGGTDDAVQILVRGIRRDNTFPVYSCKVNGAQDLDSGTLTFNVDTGHNLTAGMILRIPISNASVALSGFSWMYAKIASVTATTITLSAVPTNLGVYPFDAAITTLIDNQIINAGFASSDLENKIDINTTNVLLPGNYLGAFVRIYRTEGGGSTYYQLIDVALPMRTGSTADMEYTFTDIYSDSVLSRVPFEEQGEELPRACKYISQYQGQLVQGGRPYETESLADDYYPSNWNGDVTNAWGVILPQQEIITKNTEAALCDFQSIYWSDPLNPEGFPQSGLNEEDFQNVFADQITGMAPNKDVLFVFKNQTMGFITGELATGNIQKEILEVDVGCVSQNTIQEVNGSIMFFDAQKGFHMVVAGRLPEWIGFPISDFPKLNGFKTRDNALNFKRGRSANFRLDDKYYCFFPNGRREPEDGGTLEIPNIFQSICFVFDYADNFSTKRNCWYIHKGYLADGGFLSTNNELFVVGNSSFRKQKRTGTQYDYSDQTVTAQNAINFIYNSAFIQFGLPSIDKHFSQIVINSVVGGFELVVKQYANFLQATESAITFTFGGSTRKFIKQAVKCNIPKLGGISIGLENAVENQNVSINGWDLEYAPEFDLGESKR